MWISDHIVLEDRHFFRECCRSKDGQWFVWVYMIGSRKECEEYTYTIKIISDDREEELKFKGRCVPLDIAKEKMVQVGNCLIFPDSTAKRFSANQQRLHYQVHVVNCKSKMAAKSNQLEMGKARSSILQGETVPTSGEHQHFQTSSSAEKDNIATSASNEHENSRSKEKNPRTKASSTLVTRSTTKSKPQPGSKKRRLDSQPSTSQEGTMLSEQGANDDE